MNKFILVIKIIIYPFIRTFYWYKVEGKENIKDSGPAIFCSNHVSLLDPVLWLLIIKRRVHYMAKAELFENPIFAWFLKKCDVFSVTRGSRDLNSINNAVQLVKSGQMLGIFPEGTRSKNYKPQRAKAGIAYIANLSEAEVIPAAISCKGKLRPFKPFKLIIGEPIKYSELAFDENSKDNLRRVSGRIMGEITALWEKGLNE